MTELECNNKCPLCCNVEEMPIEMYEERAREERDKVWWKAVEKLKEKVSWGKNHGNGDLNSTKAVIKEIDKIFEEFKK